MGIKTKFALTCMTWVLVTGVLVDQFPQYAVELAMISPTGFLMFLVEASKRGWFLLDVLTAVTIVYEDENDERHELRGGEAVNFMHQKMESLRKQRDRERIRNLRAFCAGYEAKQEDRPKIEAIDEFAKEQAEEPVS